MKKFIKAVAVVTFFVAGILATILWLALSGKIICNLMGL